MSSERYEAIINKPIFPLQYQDVLNASEWTIDHLSDTNPTANKEFNNFWTRHGENMYGFFNDLLGAKRRIYSWDSRDLKSYNQGLVFGISAIENAYNREDLPIIYPSKRFLNHYFESLIAPTDEDRLITNRIKELVGVSSGQQLSPQLFNSGFDHNTFTPELIKLCSLVVKNKIQNDFDTKIDPLFTEHLQHGYLFSKLKARGSLSHGVLDANLILKERNEQAKLTRMWNTPVR